MECAQCKQPVATPTTVTVLAGGDVVCAYCRHARTSTAVDIIESLASGDQHRYECVASCEAMHLRAYVGDDGKLRCFLRELARYIEAKEHQVNMHARKDRL